MCIHTHTDYTQQYSQLECIPSSSRIRSVITQDPWRRVRTGTGTIRMGTWVAACLKMDSVVCHRMNKHRKHDIIQILVTSRGVARRSTSRSMLEMCSPLFPAVAKAASPFVGRTFRSMNSCRMKARGRSTYSTHMLSRRLPAQHDHFRS